MIIYGTDLNDDDMTVLAEKLRESGFTEGARRLEAAYQLDAKLFPVSAGDRRAFVTALDDCPVELRNLRASIYAQLTNEWRHLEGLAA